LGDTHKLDGFRRLGECVTVTRTTGDRRNVTVTISLGPLRIGKELEEQPVTDET
jgi:hypothetical protein